MSDLDRPVYLKSNVQIEPLINQWYAWPYLLSPATAAMLIANHHVKLMRSYVSAPEVHAAAVRNPAMFGGPFLDCDSSRVKEIEALIARTEQEQRPMIALADAIKQLNELLLLEGRGGSLNELYARVPDPLRGYVELIYDLNNRPGFRLLEALLFRSRYNDRKRESISISLASQHERPFAFSTPRLPGAGKCHLPISFTHPLVDMLARLRQAPQPFGQVRDALAAVGVSEETAQEWLTDVAPRPVDRYAGDGVRVRYLGHACLLIETRELAILVDPLIGYDADGADRALGFADLPAHIDYVLITHSHQDHVVLESLLQLRHKIGTVVVPRNGGALEDPSLRLSLENIGFPSVREVGPLEEIEVAGGSIMALPFLGEHGDLDIRSKTAHLVRLGGKQILCTADSANLEPRLYEHVRAVASDIDVLFIGMECEGAPLTWMYGALMLKRLDRKMDQSRRLCGSDARQALDIVRQFGAKKVFVYAMGQEPWLGFITSIRYTDESKPIVESNQLLAACREAGIPAERLFGTRDLLVD